MRVPKKVPVKGSEKMQDDELVNKVKEYLGIATDDEVVTRGIRMKTLTAKAYLIKGGAKHLNENFTDSDVACIAVGVNDLLNAIPGETKFSPAFNTLALQICRG